MMFIVWHCCKEMWNKLVKDTHIMMCYIQHWWSASSTSPPPPRQHSLSRSLSTLEHIHIVREIVRILLQVFLEHRADVPEARVIRCSHEVEEHRLGGGQNGTARLKAVHSHGTIVWPSNKWGMCKPSQWEHIMKQLYRWLVVASHITCTSKPESRKSRADWSTQTWASRPHRITYCANPNEKNARLNDYAFI